MRAVLIAVAALGVVAPTAVTSGCGDDVEGRDDRVRPSIRDVRASTPQTVGTGLLVSAANLDALVDTPLLLLNVAGDAPYEIAPRPNSEELVYELPAVLVDTLGDGTHSVSLVLQGQASDGVLVRSDPFAGFELTIARTFTLALKEVPEGSVFRNELSIAVGEGILEPGEGVMEAMVSGTFTPEGGGAPTSVEALLPVTPAERGTRDRGILILTTALGGAYPGTFDGEIALRAEAFAGGDVQTTMPLRTTLRFQPPALFSLSPTSATLEQVLVIGGGGFLGGNADEATLLRISGTFTSDTGNVTDIDTEVVPVWVSGSEVRWTLSADVMGQRLVSTLFGAASGTFRGFGVPVTLSGDQEVSGSITPFAFELGAVRQVVYLRFLPGFYESLPRFGLAAATGLIENRVMERLETIFEPWRVEVRLTRPDDVSPSGYVTIEIGGPDPNGLGLFGYDNSPGKDVGNLRLFDAIGGANAETQMDGFPGYGGVFVESMLMWSSHPELDGGEAGPEPDPLFDEIFDPVRTQPATIFEATGTGGRARMVMRAIDALGAVVGETTAHELGHSLGLAAPYGSATVFHNSGDQEGCLMDSGSARPFGERAAQPGFEPTHLCGEAVNYLDAILGSGS